MDSAYDLDPAEVSLAEKVALLEDWSGRLLGVPGVDHVTAHVLCVVEDKQLCGPLGHGHDPEEGPRAPGCGSDPVDAEAGGFETMRSVAPPVGRGWEYLLGVGWTGTASWQVSRVLAEKLHAPSVIPGAYDLVIDPTNLWLTIHESIGHATELDRAMATRPRTRGPRSPPSTSWAPSPTALRS